MKKCLICKKRIKKGYICNSCEDFLKWKHGKNYDSHIEKLKKYFSKLNKFRRAK